MKYDMLPPIKLYGFIDAQYAVNSSVMACTMEEKASLILAVQII
jgi:hypothetical protein